MLQRVNRIYALNFLNVKNRQVWIQLAQVCYKWWRGRGSSIEHRNETSGFVSGGVFRGQLSGRQSLEQYSTGLN